MKKRKRVNSKRARAERYYREHQGGCLLFLVIAAIVLSLAI